MEEQKCKFCGDEIPEDWLDGDYSLLVCPKEGCLKNITII